MIEKKCGNCEYYCGGSGLCKRYPPVYKKHGEMFSQHNEVNENDWCGEFKHKPVELVKVTKQAEEKPKELGNKRGK
jgi:hypothetical protein